MTFVRLRPIGSGAPLPLVGAPPPAPVVPRPSGSTASGSGWPAPRVPRGDRVVIRERRRAARGVHVGLRDRRSDDARERRHGKRQGDATERHHENLRLGPAVFNTVLPLNVTLAEKDWLARLVVTERERCSASSADLLVEDRATVALDREDDLALAGLGLRDGGRERDLALSVRLTPPLTAFLATLTLSLATKRETTTLRTARWSRRLVGDDDAQRLAADVGASRREVARERRGGDARTGARAEDDGGGLQPGRRARGEHDAGLARDRARPRDERGRRRVAATVLALFRGRA